MSQFRYERKYIIENLSTQKVNLIIKSHPHLFKKKYVSLSKKINSSESIIGYGAGQMTLTFAYHLKSNFKKIKYILDDDILIGHILDKNDRYYELHEQLYYLNLGADLNLNFINGDLNNLQSFISGNNYLCEDVPDCVENLPGFNYEYDANGFPLYEFFC